MNDHPVSSVRLSLRTPLTLLASAREILTSPKMLVYLIPPYLVGTIAAYFVFFWVDQFIFEKLSNWLIPTLHSWPGWISYLVVGAISFFVSLLAWLASGVASAIAGILALTVLAGFFVECFVEVALKKHDLSTEVVPGFVSSMLRSLREETKKLILLALIGVILVFSSLIPLLAPIALVLGIFLIGYDFFDIPLTLRGFSFRDRFGLVKKHLLEVLTLGAMFSLTAIIPMLPIILLPLGYLSAVRNIKQWP